MTRLREIEVKLNDPVNVAVGGQMSEIDIVTIAAPSNRQRKSAIKVKQLYSRAKASNIDRLVSRMTPEQLKAGEEARKDRQDEDSEEKTEKVTAKSVVDSIASSDIDMEEVMESLETLLCGLGTDGKGGCCTIGGVGLKRDLFADFSLEDSENLLGEYVSNFLNS